MSTSATQSSVVSPRITALILSSPHLKRMLLPEGLVTSPYEVLDYRTTLTLEDPRGMRATFHRTQQVRFLQDGVSGILDHFWGAGLVLTFYQNGAGELGDSFKDEGRRHLVIRLKRTMQRGERLGFAVVRRAMAEFTQDEEWEETRIDHPVRHIQRRIVFPAERPCRQAVLQYEGTELSLPVTKLAGGKSLVHFDIDRPRMDTSYVVRWVW